MLLRAPQICLPLIHPLRGQESLAAFCETRKEGDVGLAGVENRSSLLQLTGPAPVEHAPLARLLHANHHLLLNFWPDHLGMVQTSFGLHHCLGLPGQMPTLHFRAGLRVLEALSFVRLVFVLHSGENSSSGLVTDWAWEMCMSDMD